MRSIKTRLTTIVAALALVAVTCSDDDVSSDIEGAAEPEPTAITVVTHDSFAVPGELLDAFTAETGITVELLSGGDTGQLVAEAILTAGSPLGDVLFGIDNTFLQRGLDADLFEPYESPLLGDVPAEFQLDDQHRVTPIDYGDVCINYWIDALPGDAPTSLDDLLDPSLEGQLVVQNPETSSPGLAFLLATIAEYGDGWEEYWASLRENGVAVTRDWESAYWGEFVSGGGDRSLVVSYASSPPAEVLFAAEPLDTAPTGVLTASCYRQIEFAGILAGTDAPAAAGAFIDFMLGVDFQNEVPLGMFVFPVSTAASLPPEFADHVVLADDPHILDPAYVESNREEWTERWVEIVLR
jgi:thiamine transport system substrate-binding protein